jgi:monolysocardiolipin acyltransferase
MTFLLYIFTAFLNSTTIRNKEALVSAVFNRPAGVPLITVTNHESCIDDPGLIGNFMTYSQLLNQPKMRWALSAHDICYTRKIYSSFFSHGKCIPVVRGWGVYQKAVDFCIERLNQHGDWVHIFPEGKVNMERKGLLRLKWGVGRMIAELDTVPIVLPFWSVGKPFNLMRV